MSKTNEARRHRKEVPPWTQPGWCLWLAAAMAFSLWLTLVMPLGGMGSHGMRQGGGAAMHPTSSQPQDAPARPHGMRGADKRTEEVVPKAHTRTTPPGEKVAENAGETVSEGQDAARLDSQKPAQTRRHRRQAEADTPWNRILDRLVMFGRLFSFVFFGAILGGIIEYRRWYLCLARTLGRVTHAARLPEIVGIAMPTALASAPAANSMLAATHARGDISDSALIAGGMTNSFLAYFSHSARSMYPVLAAIGLPGAFFFLFQISGELLVILGVLLWNRLSVMREERLLAENNAAAATSAIEQETKGEEEKNREETGRDASCEPPCERSEGAATAASSPVDAPVREPRILPWPETLRKSVLRALTLLFRLSSISVPVILVMEWFIRTGALGFWERYAPEAITAYFPQELLAIIAAQMGGIINASTVASGLAAQGLVTGPQILLAMLVASAIGNPFRALRRNLPTALAIFPTRIALTIVLGMQVSRFLVAAASAALVVFWMRCQL